MHIRLKKNQTSQGFFLLLFLSAIELVVAMTQIISGASGGGNWTNIIFFVTFVWFVIYFWTSFLFHRTLYLFSNAYLIGLALFHLGLIYLIVFDQVEVSSWVRGPRSWQYEMAGWYIVLALSAFGIGQSLGGLGAGRKKRSAHVKELNILEVNRFIYAQGIGLFMIGLIFLFIALKSYGNILAYSRAELFNLKADSRGFGLFMMVMPGAIMLLTVSARTRIQKIFSYSLAVVFFLLILLSGYRSAALMPALVGVIIWVKTGRKIPVVIAITAIIFVLVAISVVSIFRQMGSYEKLGAEQLRSSYESSRMIDSFAEMGASVGVLSEVLRLIPKKESYRYGYSYWIAIKEMIPNVSLSIDSSESRKSKLAQAAFSKAKLKEMAPADWITYKVNRWKFDHGQGLGFSAIAEPYLNFGMIGVIFYFSILGFILFRFDNKEINYHPYIYLFAGAIYWTFIRTVRNDFRNFMKPMAFLIIILLIYNFFLWAIGKKFRFIANNNKL